jgi:hypothetical protein
MCIMCMCIVQADFHKMPFEDNSFDHCYSIEACCHSPDRCATKWEAAAQRLRPIRPHQLSYAPPAPDQAQGGLQPRPASANRQVSSGCRRDVRWLSPLIYIPASFTT